MLKSFSHIWEGQAIIAGEAQSFWAGAAWALRLG
jgi:hypothetical protein